MAGHRGGRVILAGLALLQAQAGDEETARELARQVLQHRASSGNTKSRAQQVGAMLDCPPEKNLSASASMFEEMVRKMLAGS